MEPSLLPAIAAFAQVARFGSFTRAAANLGVSPSALSQTIGLLERRLGVRLFNRTTRSVSLTEEGRLFLQQVAHGLACLDRALNDLDEVRERPTGEVRVNLSRFASEYLIEPHLAEFARLYPQIRLELILDDGLADIVLEGCDIGIRLGEHLSAGMVAVPVGPPLCMVVVGSPVYFANHPLPQTPGELDAHNCLRFRKTSNGTVYRWEFNDPDGDAALSFDFEPRGSFTTNDHDTMIRAAVQGVGLIQHLDAAVAGYVAAGRLIPVLETWCPPFPGFHLYTSSRALVPPKIRAVIDFLKRKKERLEKR